jgi:phosphatidylglycerol:prolipoprotein diacylglycerol transferase
MHLSEQYWTFHLSPYVFQVQDINFQWLLGSFWGIFVFFFVLVGGIFFSRFQIQKAKASDHTVSPEMIKIIARYSLLQTFLIYSFAILAVLFLLQKMGVHWGLRWYSTMYFIAFTCVYFACMSWIKKKTLMLTESMLMNLITFCIFGTIIGARIAYVFIYNWDFYKDHPLEIIATWEGGLSFHGGMVGVGCAILFYCRKNKIPFFHLTDKLVRIVPIGIGFGRIGNFMNGELWGRPIGGFVPWAVIFPDAGADIPRHPSQIYQSLAEGFGLFLTLFLLSRWKHREGTMSGFFIIFYCLYRFGVEYFRAADMQVSYFYLSHFSWAPLNVYAQVKWWQILTMGQILCFVFFIYGILIVFLTRKNILEGSSQWRSRNHEFFKKYSLENVK